MRAIVLPLIAGLMAVSACAPVPVEKPAAIPTGLDTFLVPAYPLPFTVEGSVLVHDGEESSSGSMILEADERGALRFRLYARVTGALLADVRIDRERLLLLDHAHATYFQGPNTPRNRKRWLELDLSDDDLLLLVTARMAHARFIHGQGRRSDGAVAIVEEPYDYRFTIGPQGLPATWRKRAGGETLFRVDYRGYQDFTVAAGRVMRLPEKIRVFDQEGKLRLILGVGTFSAAQAHAPPIDFSFTPAPPWQPMTSPNAPDGLEPAPDTDTAR